MDSSNPLYKFKVQVSIVWVVLQGILAALIYFGKLDASTAEMIKQVMVGVTVIAGLVITGHAATDIAGVVSSAKLQAQDIVTEAEGKINTINHAMNVIATKKIDDPTAISAAVTAITDTIEAVKNKR